MIKLFIAAGIILGLTGVTTAAPYNGYIISDTHPIDTVSEAKFPNVNPKLIDELAHINKYVNSAIAYEYDSDHYGTDDMWVMDPKDRKGDCEDYALTKLSMIEQAGDRDVNDPTNEIPSTGDTKLVYVDVYYDDYDDKGVQEDGHEILAVRLPDKSVAYLDLNNEELMTRKELTRWNYAGGEAYRYVFYDWKG